MTAEPVSEGRAPILGDWQIDKEGRIYCRPAPLVKYVIAEMETGDERYEQLILTAPEMLTQLRNASWLLADISPDGLVKKQIDEVIAKATGAA